MGIKPFSIEHSPGQRSTEDDPAGLGGFVWGVHSGFVPVPRPPEAVASFTTVLPDGWYIVVGVDYLFTAAWAGGTVGVAAKLVSYDAASRLGTFEVRSQVAEELGRLLGR